MEKREKLIEMIVNAKGYKVALLTTFNFNIDFFEKTMLNRLFDNNVRTVTLFVDSVEFNTALSRAHASNLGKRYVVSPVFMSGAFHPKVVLLLGDKQARLIVASSNLTEAGYEKNNEIYNVLDYTNEEPQNQDLIVRAMDFFLNLRERSANLDKRLLEDITLFGYYRRGLRSSERYFLTNLETNILTQVGAIIKEEVSEIWIAAPYFDARISALDKLRETFLSANITLYIQQGTSTFPTAFQDAYDIKLFRGFTDSESGRNFYHGKVFLFKTPAKDYVLYGSANCTMNALVKTWNSGGNIEASIMDEGSPGEFDGFFECMEIVSGEPVKSLPSDEVNLHTSSPFQFISAEKSVSGLACSLRGSSFDATIQIIVGDIVYKPEWDGDILSFIIPAEDAELLANTFELIVSCSQGNFPLYGWTLDWASIESNRNASSEASSPRMFDPYALGTKYHEAVMNLLSAEQMCFSELEDAYRRSAWHEQQRMLAESGEDDGADDSDFIVDIELSYDDRVAFKKYEYIESVRNRYLGWFFRPWDYIREREEAARVRSENTEEASSRLTPRLSNEDKEFARFIKQRIRGWYDQRYLDKIDPMHFIGLARTTFIEIFNKTDVVSLFDVAYVVKHRIGIVSAVLSLNLTKVSSSEDVEERIVVWALCVILANHQLISERCEYEEKDTLSEYNRQFLFDLEVSFSIREKLWDYIRLAGDKSQNDDYQIPTDIGLGKAWEIIDALYGCKSEPQLFDFLKEKYGSEAQIEIDEDRITVRSVLSKIMSYKTVDDYIVNEVKAFAKYSNPSLRYLVVEITNAVSGAYVFKITNTVSLDTIQRCRRVIEYSDGKKELAF